MRSIIFIILISLFTPHFVFAEASADEVVEEKTQDQIEQEARFVEMAETRSYPGGMDEEDLFVQEELSDMDPHLTAATLQWRTLNSINRASASESEDTVTSEE